MRNTQKIIKNIAVWLFVIIAVMMMFFTILSVSMFDRNQRSLFGYKFFIVTSDSMAATDFKAGDIVIVKHTDPETLKEGDIIAFLSTDPKSFGATVTHKIRSATYDAQGNPGFITYGTTNDQNDRTIVTYDYILGIYRGRIPQLGTFVAFFKTPPGYLVCILFPFSLLLISLGLDCFRLFQQYRKEQEALLKAEQAENQQLKAELEGLKAKLSLQAEENAAVLTAPENSTQRN